MILLLLPVLLQGLPDPAAMVFAVEDTPHGLLLTDGRGCGLYLLEGDGSLITLSDEPGAGRNVVVYRDGLLLKECPEGEEQRVVSVMWTGERSTVFSGEFFSGPFKAGNDSFILSQPGKLSRLDIDGNVLDSWDLDCYSASAALSNGRVFYTRDSGGIGILDIATGIISIEGELDDRCLISLTAGPDGMVLCEFSSGGFAVLDSHGCTLLADEDGRFPSWTMEGDVIFSSMEFRGLEPVDGSIHLADPLTGNSKLIRDEGGVPLRPVELENGDFTWTSPSGVLHGSDVVLPIEQSDPEGPRFDPDGHIDVVYMHQRWDTPDWFNGSWSCGPTSCMMATQYYRMLTPDSIWASSPTGHWSLWGNYIPVEYTFLGYTYDDLGLAPDSVYVPGAHGFICPDGGAWWNLMVDFLNGHQISSAWAGTAWATVMAEIDDLYPVVCSSSVLGYGHIILLCGYYSDHTVVVNDPYGDANLPGWGNYYNGKDVLYDWPGYNNGHLQIGVSQLFYARGRVPSVADTLVDDCSTGFFKYGNCQYWHLTESGFQGRAWWTYSTGAPPDTCIAYWYPELPGAGWYDVSVYIPPDHADACGTYRLTTQSGVQDITLDQGLYSDQWVDLGSYSLDSSACVRLGDFTGTAGEYIAFDALKFAQTTGSISRDPGVPDLHFWPNPAGNHVSITVPGAEASFTVQLFDLSGRLVVSGNQEEAAGIFELDTSALAAGIYLIRVTTGGNSSSGLISVCPGFGGD